MAFQIFDQVFPSCKPTASAAATFPPWPKQLLWSTHPCTPVGETTPTCTLSGTVAARQLFPGSIWKGLEARLFFWHVLSMQRGCWRAGRASQGGAARSSLGITKASWVHAHPSPFLQRNHSLQKLSIGSEVRGK